MRLLRAWLILLLSAALASGCARVVEHRDAEGRVERGPVFERDGVEVRHGMWTGTHPDGSRAWKVRYVRGTPTGLRREWHPNGARAAEIKLGWDGQPLAGARHKRWTEDGTEIPQPAPEPTQKEKPHG